MFKFYVARYVIFDENFSCDRVAAMMLAMVVARGEGYGVDQERLRNGNIEGDMTVKAARADVKYEVNCS